MSEPILDVESVVREVLAELGIVRNNNAQSSTMVGVGSSNDNFSNGNSSDSVDSNNSGELAIASHIVTMSEISGRLDSVRRVLVSREALVTPAVRDELLRRGINLAFADSPNSPQTSPIRLVLITMGTDFDPTSLTAGLTREGLKVEHAALDCLISATNQLASETAKPDTLGVLLTRHTAAGLCLANRLHGVRAVTGADAPAVAAAAAAVGANLLVADPLAGTFFQLKQMVSEFGRGGVRPCPAVFRTQLA